MHPTRPLRPEQQRGRPPPSFMWDRAGYGTFGSKPAESGADGGFDTNQRRQIRCLKQLFGLVTSSYWPVTNEPYGGDQRGPRPPTPRRAPHPTRTSLLFPWGLRRGTASRGVRPGAFGGSECAVSDTFQWEHPQQSSPGNSTAMPCLTTWQTPGQVVGAAGGLLWGRGRGLVPPEISC